MKRDLGVITNGIGGEQIESWRMLNIENRLGTFYAKSHTEAGNTRGKL